MTKLTTLIGIEFEVLVLFDWNIASGKTDPGYWLFLAEFAFLLGLKKVKPLDLFFQV